MYCWMSKDIPGARMACHILSISGHGLHILPDLDPIIRGGPRWAASNWHYRQTLHRCLRGGRGVGGGQCVVQLALLSLSPTPAPQMLPAGSMCERKAMEGAVMGQERCVSALPIATPASDDRPLACSCDRRAYGRLLFVCLLACFLILIPPFTPYRGSQVGLKENTTQ